ncbi:putative quinol monooxygenase [Aspergillus saccharolyticus JOP 1030-1]|uniref:ABM domain-containing protein n=1 Tax=Aspergillus saccharolyticus JOP 1030-1 TaxID=1450539 RepID=A0A318ZC96_9EURO|nr:hypothetical protein BP01DRAFT_357313 [Aspergillus saccharolyticus JOP 1030-1]PYH44959.1 hypothetical protein BP01DRAFT_357313 [Aspergillus saccharolyticus JOP 1030-1]
MASTEVNVTVVAYPQPNKVDEVATLWSELSRQVQANEPDTLFYYAYINQDRTAVVVVERYRNQEALVKHSQTPYYQAFMAKAGGLMAKPLEIQLGGGQLPESTKISRL